MRTKRCLTVLLCLLLCLGLLPLSAPAAEERYPEINETNFPDDIFRQWVVDNLAGGKDCMTKGETDAVTAPRRLGGEQRVAVPLPGRQRGRLDRLQDRRAETEIILNSD